MEIDFSPLESSLNGILFGLIKVLGVPLVGSLVVGFLLRMIKVPRGIVIAITSLIFVFGVYQMFMIGI